MNKVSLKPGKEKSLKNRHPWIFSGAIANSPQKAQPGELVEVTSSSGKFLGNGYINPNSQIRVRIYSWHKGEVLDRTLLKQRIQESIDRRAHIDRNQTDCIRLVAHDADYIPGLVIDQYGPWVSFQILTAGMEALRDPIIEIIQELLAPEGLVERSDESVRKKEGLPLRKKIIFGTLPEGGVLVKENGMKLLVDIWDGHKTGFYIDQRDNRDIIRQYSQGKRVLNCFSYTGGFSIAAGIGGAKEVISVDDSLPALEIAEKNWALNELGGDPSFIKADVFQYLRHLKDEGETFDFIILDPPKFASSQRNLNGACRGYKDLNLLALQLLKPGGLLASYSCSGLISRELFQKVVFGAAVDADAKVQIIKHLSQSEDHPTCLAFPESLYLKGFLMRKVK